MKRQVLGLVVVAMRWCVLGAALLGGVWAQDVQEKLPGLEMSVFTPEGMLGSVVALSVDEKGGVYVTQTERRAYGTLDLAHRRDWVVETLGSESIEDKRGLVRRRFDGGAPGDVNEDGMIDWNDLAVSSEQVVVVRDGDGDGVADGRDVFAEGFRGEIAGMAGGLLVHEEGVYAAMMPSLWRLRDGDGDGQAEDKEAVVTGFGLHVGRGGHDMHGVVRGPDGKIYWSVGDEALSVTGAGGERVHLPYQGAILRSEPDGSGVEVFAKGLRDPHALAFDAAGELFVVDSGADLGDQARLHYVLPGSDSGWRAYYHYRNDESWGEMAGYNVWMEESLWKLSFPGQTAAVTPPVAHFSEGPAGMVYQPGTALSEAYEDHFLLTEFPGRRLQAFRVIPEEESAGYRMGAAQEVFGGQMLLGLAFGPGGRLFAADWGSEGEPTGLPHGKGRVLRLDIPEGQAHPMRKETAQWLGEDWERLPEGQLAGLLGYPDQRVRLRAQFEIVRRGDFTVFRQTAVADSRKLARIHALWGGAQLVRQGRGESLQSMASLARHPDPDIRVQALRVLGETGSSFALELVKARLFDSNPRVRMQAALALHGMAGAKDLEDIVAYIAANGEEDAFRRHGGVRALAGVGRGWPELLLDYQDHSSRAVRMAVVVALRHLHEEEEMKRTLEDPETYHGLANFLDDADENIVMEAARAIHDVAVPSRQALGSLASLLGNAELPGRGPLVRRAIHANRMLAGEGAAMAERLLLFAGRPSAAVALRTEALETAATWNRELKVDRVLGMPRSTAAGAAGVMETALGEHVGTLFAGEVAGESYQKALIALVREMRYLPAAERLGAWVRSEAMAAPVRVAALEAMEAMEAPEAEELAKWAATSEIEALRRAAERVLSGKNS